MKPGNWVLCYAGEGLYEVRKIVKVTEGGYEISQGHYSTFYAKEDVHKCPASLVKQKEYTPDERH